MTDAPLQDGANNPFDAIRAGEIRTGRVVNISDHEVLVEMDGFSGAKPVTARILSRDLSLHLSEHPSKVVGIGQRLTFEVFEIDREHEYVWGSASACEDLALRDFLLSLRRGAIHRGRVRSVHTYGVFVNLDDEPDGLCTGFIRGPELTWAWINEPADVVTVGQPVVGEILDVNRRRGQVQLSLKALQTNPLVPFRERIGQTAVGRVTTLLSFGAVVRLAEGVEGFVHNTELADAPVDDPARIVREGDEITVRIVAVDLARQRLSLSARSCRTLERQTDEPRPGR
ncbi:S1 RNA-binding domain-containing protein [Streptomyces sp. NPDC093801]|uniref:S1 RNA-binding domain-containing protein n=1 Tax=Streptomyces sp. NPDC093801 TaxID=3155203 RepID=UPI00344EDA18